MQRDELLAQASILFMNCLDYEATIQKIVELVTGSGLATWCIVDVVGEGGKVQRVAAAHVDPAKLPLIHRLREKYPAKPTAQRGVYKVIATGKSIFIPQLTDEMLRARADDEEHYQLVSELGHRSYMCVPLLARGHVIGTILLYSDSREFGEADLSLAEELALRSALAVDNSRMFRKAQEAIALRDEFLAIAAHELRSPLTPLKGHTSIIKRVLEGYELRPEDSARLKRCLESSEREVDRLARLINQLMDVSRLHCQRMELDLGEVELVSLAGEVIRRFQAQFDKAACTVEFEASDPIKGVWDRFRLDQVFNNLLSNAIKYAPGGPVKIRAYKQEGFAGLTITTIQRKLSDFLKASRSTIYLSETQSGETYLKATYIDGPLGIKSHIQKVVRPGAGIIGYCMAHRSAVWVEDIRKDSRFQTEISRRLDGSSTYKTGSFIVVPLVIGSELLGVITVADRTDAKSFSRADFCVLHLVAKDLAFILVNARLGHDAKNTLKLAS